VDASGGLLILAVWLCATLMFIDRRLGLVVVLLRGNPRCGGSHPPHAGQGTRRRPDRGQLGGALFWVWTLVALGANGMLSIVLAVRALWTSFRSAEPS
jgi:hypothetical protein